MTKKRKNTMKKITLVAPFYNEEENVNIFKV
jgi:hypothetical protein